MRGRYAGREWKYCMLFANRAKGTMKTVKRERETDRGSFHSLVHVAGIQLTCEREYYAARWLHNRNHTDVYQTKTIVCVFFSVGKRGTGRSIGRREKCFVCCFVHLFSFTRKSFFLVWRIHFRPKMTKKEEKTNSTAAFDDVKKLCPLGWTEVSVLIRFCLFHSSSK